MPLLLSITRSFSLILQTIFQFGISSIQDSRLNIRHGAYVLQPIKHVSSHKLCYIASLFLTRTSRPQAESTCHYTCDSTITHQKLERSQLSSSHGQLQHPSWSSGLHHWYPPEKLSSSVYCWLYADLPFTLHRRLF